MTVTVDRPLGSRHPNHPDTVYPVNYGYVEGLMAGDNEPQDTYILGVKEPLSVFTGRVIAVIHRNNDVEKKWVVAPENTTFSKVEIKEKTWFVEKYFNTKIIMDEDG